MYNHLSYSYCKKKKKKASNQISVAWLRSKTNHAEGKSQCPTGLFFARFKAGGTAQLNLYILLQHLQSFSSFQENDTKSVE